MTRRVAPNIKNGATRAKNHIPRKSSGNMIFLLVIAAFLMSPLQGVATTTYSLACYITSMESVTNFLAGILRPFLAPISRWLLSEKRVRPTWHYETAVVGSILFSVALLTAPPLSSALLNQAVLIRFLIVWLSACATLGSFLHAKVGYRMSEALRASQAPDVSCYEWSDRYWLSKEILWFIVFLLSGAYPAIAGSVIFILYPVWRKIHLEERARVRRTTAKSL